MNTHHELIRRVLEDQPQWLHNDVRYVCIPDSDEPEPCLSTTAMKAFLAWSLEMGIVGKPEKVPAYMQLMDDLPELHRAHEIATCNPETCPICRQEGR